MSYEKPAPTGAISRIPPRTRPLVVLHVDDDPINRRVVAEILKLFGHEAVSASGGREGLELMAVQAFDVVLMDIHMPEMGGLEAVDRLRSTPGLNRDVSVIALTADTTSRTRDEYLVLGFDDLVFKPILIPAFREAVERAAIFERKPVVPPLAATG